jgi:hypothetical protein
MDDHALLLVLFVTAVPAYTAIPGYIYMGVGLYGQQDDCDAWLGTASASACAARCAATSGCNLFTYRSLSAASRCPGACWLLTAGRAMNSGDPNQGTIGLLGVYVRVGGCAHNTRNRCLDAVHMLTRAHCPACACQPNARRPAACNAQCI